MTFNGVLTSRGFFGRILPGLLTALVFIGIFVANTSLLSTVSTWTTDLTVDSIAKGDVSGAVIVEVDERSLNELGQWPWSRDSVAMLVDRVHAFGPQSLTIDALFVEPDRTSPKFLSDMLKKKYGIDQGFASLPPEIQDNDAILAKAMQRSSAIIGFFFTQSQFFQECFPKTATGAFADKSQTGMQNIFSARSAICNLPTIQDQVAGSGFNNGFADADGLFRRMPMLIEHQGRLFPSLALQAYIHSKGKEQFTVLSEYNGFLIKAAGRDIRVDAAANLHLAFAHKSIDKISAIDLLSGKVEASKLKGKHVVLGFSAIGLTEYRPIRKKPNFTGAELHALTLANLESNDLFYDSNHRVFYELLFGILLACLISYMLSMNSKFGHCFWAVPTILAALFVLVCVVWVIQTRVLFSPSIACLMIAFSAVLAVFTEYIRARLEHVNLNADLQLAQQALIQSMCAIADYRSPQTGGHIKRIQRYVKELSNELKENSVYKSYLNQEMLRALYDAAPLYDVGKVGVRDEVLLKPGALTDSEFDAMRLHPVIGGKIIKEVSSSLRDNTFLRVAEEMALCHHEAWDGSGYPRGLTGRAIPVSARILAVADVYDALISKSIYKQAYPHVYAVSYIAERVGKQFDPDVVEAFLKVEQSFLSIATEFADNNEQRLTLLIDEPLELSERDITKAISSMT